jgi:hypothetical protein
MEGMEGPTMGTEQSSHGTHASSFSYKTHAYLSSCLKNKCLHSLTEKTLMEILECRGPIVLLVVVNCLSINRYFRYFVRVVN